MTSGLALGALLTVAAFTSACSGGSEAAGGGPGPEAPSGSVQGLSFPGLAVAGDELEAGGLEGGPFGPDAVYTLSSTGGKVLWKAKSSVQWLEFSKSQGTLTKGGSTEVLVSIKASVANNLPPGTYTGSIIFSDRRRDTDDLVFGAELTIDPQGAPPPILTAVTPSEGPPAGGNRVTLTGSGFFDGVTGTSNVTFGGKQATNIQEPNGSTLTCDVPAGTAGTTVDVVLTNGNGTARLQDGYSYTTTGPAIVSVTPSSGPPAGGNQVTISGSGFLDGAPGTSNVTFGGTSATNIVEVNDATITCRVPAGAAGALVDVSVSNAKGMAVLANAYTYDSSPTLTSVSPSNGPPEGGNSVTLRGSGFVDGAPGTSSVTFGGSSAMNIVEQSDSTITCGVPAGMAGARVDIVLSNANGTATLPAAYTYLSSGNTPTLLPGGGWSGPGVEPGPISGGTRYDTAKVIARFDFVVNEFIDQPFGVGLVAFHANGIDRIEMAVEGGPIVTIVEPTLNPSTGIVEYWAQLNPADFATHGTAELRAVAYPRNGGAPKLRSRELYVDPGTHNVVETYCSPSGSDSNNGSASNPCRNIARAARRAQDQRGSNADGAIIYLAAGSYEWKDTGDVVSNSKSWTRIMPAPGVSRSQVKIVNDDGFGPDIKYIQCVNVTFDRATMRLAGQDNGQRFYGVDCLIKGPDVANTSGRNGTNWLAGNSWGGVYYSGCEWRDTYTGPERAVLVRNCHCVNIAEDVYGSTVQMLLNSSVDNMDAGILNDDSGADLNIHSDVWALGLGQDYDNIICYGLKATSCSGQGLWFSADNKNLPSLISNVAIVNFQMYNRVGGLRGNSKSHFGADSRLDHVLLMGSLFDGQTIVFNYDEARSENILIKGNCFDKVNTDGGENSGIPSPNLNSSVIEFVENHYIDTSGLEPGTGVTTGDAGWTAHFDDSGYRVANSGGYGVGSKTIAVGSGSIALEKGMMITFGSLPPNKGAGNRDFTPREYTISQDVGPNANSITIEPGLRESIPNGDTLIYTDYRPYSGSLLRGRVVQPYVPVDIDQVTRAPLGTVGAYE